MDYEIPERCENPIINCTSTADVEIKHEHYNEDGSELLGTTTLGWLCQACAMKVVLNRMRPVDHTLN